MSRAAAAIAPRPRTAEERASLAQREALTVARVEGRREGLEAAARAIRAADARAEERERQEPPPAAERVAIERRGIEAALVAVEQLSHQPAVRLPERQLGRPQFDRTARQLLPELQQPAGGAHAPLMRLEAALCGASRATYRHVIELLRREGYLEAASLLEADGEAFGDRTEADAYAKAGPNSFAVEVGS